MSLHLFLLIIVVITALAFDFTNGFHDTGNAMATSIASGALKPKTAVTLSAVLNLIGAFLSTAVAATIAKDLVDSHLVSLELVFAGLVGGIVWNLLTWLLGIPSSSSHALIGGIVGATIAAVGGHGVIWRGVVSHVVIPAIVGSDRRHRGRRRRHVAGLPRSIRGVDEKRTEKLLPAWPDRLGRRWCRWRTAPTTRQKTMGVIFLALMSYGAVSKYRDPSAVVGHRQLRGWRWHWAPTPAAGASSAPSARDSSRSSLPRAWRPSRRPPQSSCYPAHFGYALSTTQVVTGSVLGSGDGQTRRTRSAGAWPAGWHLAWLITLPSAGGVGCGHLQLVHGIGGYVGAILGVTLLITVVLAIYAAVAQAVVDHSNVNDEWEGSLTAGLDAPAGRPVPARPEAVRPAAAMGR